MNEIEINLPGWPQTSSVNGRRVFQGDGYKLIIDTSRRDVDVEITIKETPAIELTDE